jgi:hypothetical protein
VIELHAATQRRFASSDSSRLGILVGHVATQVFDELFHLLFVPEHAATHFLLFGSDEFVFG